ncbi:MAG TPA: bifunctional phosphopantothenoylcysteine decarboxylase/phosphopantothenate--cysteine ligase CoaBC [Nitrospinota bacterium]|nr:bifunctional phosphopantothenoylcysteine decarboxylase/phosphopantothenate--cysteine ligase CoaBC [Nitrospinota bacterium]
MIKEKLIVLGVTGGIAAYKSAEIIRGLIKLGARVKVVMTKNAKEFITPLTLQTLSKNPVICDMFSLDYKEEIEHISLPEELDLLLVAPATANIIGKFANGIADDFLSTLFLSIDRPIIIAPAMNEKMYANKTVRHNIDKLRANGIEIIDPGYGELACDTVGWGRLADEETIIKKVEDVLKRKQDLLNKKVMITAGPTQEPMDSVRFLTNLSSGKMGYALAKEAKRRGAEVILISGPTHLMKPHDIDLISIRTAEEMRKEAMDNFNNADIVIKASAVSDFRPKKSVSHKIKKESENIVLELERTPDILEEMGSKKGNKILIGFAAETENIIKNAKEKIKRKNLDLVVANDVSKKDIGFQSDLNKAFLIFRDGEIKDLPVMTKELLAKEILDSTIKIIQDKER